MNRREFVSSATGAAMMLGAGAVASGAAGPGTAEGLNVLFIMTDEQHWRSLSCTGNPYIQTPNMDRLAREGALFENATCVTPYCSPSRASFITGVYPHRHRILSNVSPGRNEQPSLKHDAFPNTECILHESGYATKHRGKWHLGDTGEFPCYEKWGYGAKDPKALNQLINERIGPPPAGFDKKKGGFLGRPVAMIPAIKNAWQPFQSVANLGYIATIGRTDVPPELLPETQITNQALEFIEASKDGAFMLTVSWSPPHDLWVTPEPYYSMVDRARVELPGTTDLQPWDKNTASRKLGELAGPEGIREYAAIYHGMVKYIDDQLGRILTKLDDLNLAGRTLVLFTSDHGDMVGAHGCIGKSVTSCFDDLVRIPLLMRLPGRIKPGTVVRQPVSQIDIMPTILDYVGKPVPGPIHGQSLRPLIEGRNVPWRDYAFCQRADRVRMLRAGGWKYQIDARKGGILSLYDLENDPHEDRNLARDAAAAKQVRAMHARLLEIMKTDGDPLVKSLPADPLA